MWERENQLTCHGMREQLWHVGFFTAPHSHAVFYPSSAVTAGNWAGTALFVLGGW